MEAKKIFRFMGIGVFSFLLFNSSVFASPIINVENDNDSTYIPTNIVNGSFDDEPFMKYEYNGVLYNSCPHGTVVDTPSKIYFNGVDEGWNTTETTIWNSNLFEFSNGVGNHNIGHNTTVSPSDKYVEMNNVGAAMLYQDLTTYGNDVILWKLKHAMTTSKMNQDKSIQSMRVEIGAPNMDSGKVVDAHGLGDSIDPEIDLSTKAIYRSTDVTDSNGDESILGYAGSDISNLYLSYPDNSNGWYTASGIYIVPENQSITRFGFVSEAKVPSVGNLLDDIEFSTLIGNLSAVYNDDKTATVTGYWGEFDPSKKLVIKIGTDIYELDMSGVTGNFKFNISEEIIGKETYIQVYHEDYEQVKKEVKIVSGKVTRETSGTGEKIKIISDDDTIINSLDDESKNKIMHGEDVNILIDIKNITDSFDDEEIFTSSLNNYLLGEIYDVSLYKKLESDEENVKVSETSELLEFSIELPNNLIGIDRDYKIVSYYDGNIDVLDCIYDKDLNILTFKTNRLSKFAIVYNDKFDNPKTVDNINFYTFIGLISLIGLVYSINYEKKY